MECFIYAITNIVTGRRYIGSCLNVKRRFGEHRSALKHNKHHCEYLQNSFNKHGRDSFTFSVIRALASNDRAERSAAELEEIAKAPCFNSLIAHTELQNFTTSDKVRSRISASGKLRYEQQPEIAAAHSEKMKARFADPKERVALSISILACQTIEVRAKKSAAALSSWRDDAVRKKRLNRTYSSECTLSKSEKMKAFWASPEGQLAKVRQKAAVQAHFAAKRLAPS